MAQKQDAQKNKRMKATFTFDGKRYFVNGYSKKELDDKIYEKRKELETGAKNRVNPTLNNYYERFTDNRRRKVKESTIRCQSFQFRNCADVVIANGKTLGEYRIRDIMPDDIQLVQNELAKTKRKTETVNNCIDHLRHVFNQAVRSRYLDFNPCDAVENIKRTEPAARDTIHRALSEAETKKFFETARETNSFYYNHFAVLVKTGLRIGELAALTAFDIDNLGVDPETHEKQYGISVNKTVTKDEIGAFIISNSPKTDAGNRVIPIKGDVVELIENQKKKNKVLTLDRARAQIFKTPEGALLREYQVNREIGRICKKAGIEKFTCHALRATFATRFIEQRPQDYKILSEILGHSTVKITLNLYTHVMKENKITAMQNIDIAI